MKLGASDMGDYSYYYKIEIVPKNRDSPREFLETHG